MQTTTADLLQGQSQQFDLLGNYAAIAGSSTTLSNIGTASFTFTAPVLHT